MLHCLQCNADGHSETTENIVQDEDKDGDEESSVFENVNEQIASGSRNCEDKEISKDATDGTVEVSSNQSS